MKEVFKQFLLLTLVISILVFGFMLLGIAEGKSPGLNSEWRTATASWYGPGFYNQHTANGELLTLYIITVAHRTLPFNTVVEIWFQGESVFARVNDRGPYYPGREFDLSAMTARILGFSGVQEIQWRLVYLPEGAVDARDRSEH